MTVQSMRQLMLYFHADCLTDDIENNNKKAIKYHIKELRRLTK